LVVILICTFHSNGIGMSAVAQSVKMLTDVQKKYTFCKCNGV